MSHRRMRTVRRMQIQLPALIMPFGTRMWVRLRLAAQSRGQEAGWDAQMVRAWYTLAYRAPSSVRIIDPPRTAHRHIRHRTTLESEMRYTLLTNAIDLNCCHSLNDTCSINLSFDTAKIWTIQCS